MTRDQIEPTVWRQHASRSVADRTLEDMRSCLHAISLCVAALLQDLLLFAFGRIRAYVLVCIPLYILAHVHRLAQLYELLGMCVPVQKFYRATFEFVPEYTERNDEPCSELDKDCLHYMDALEDNEFELRNDADLFLRCPSGSPSLFLEINDQVAHTEDCHSDAERRFHQESRHLPMPMTVDGPENNVHPCGVVRNLLDWNSLSKSNSYRSSLLFPRSVQQVFCAA